MGNKWNYDFVNWDGYLNNCFVNWENNNAIYYIMIIIKPIKIIIMQLRNASIAISNSYAQIYDRNALAKQYWKEYSKIYHGWPKFILQRLLYVPILLQYSISVFEPAPGPRQAETPLNQAACFSTKPHTLPISLDYLALFHIIWKLLSAHFRTIIQLRNYVTKKLIN